MKVKLLYKHLKQKRETAMTTQDKNNTFHAMLAITFVMFLLWATNPSDAIKDCEKVNTVEMCNVLNAE